MRVVPASASYAVRAPRSEHSVARQPVVLHFRFGRIRRRHRPAWQPSLLLVLVRGLPLHSITMLLGGLLRSNFRGDLLTGRFVCHR